MYEVNFQPFIGKNYHLQSPKILVLGESHYSGEGDDLGKEFTDYVVRRYAKRETGERRPFFTIIAKIIDNQLNNETAKDLWDNVAFYNYVQVLVGKGPRERPTDEMFNKSNEAFRQVITELKPDIVVVLGRRLSSHLDYYKDSFNSFLSETILCKWTHPSTPKYFKAHEAIECFEVAQRQFAQTRIA